MSWLLNRGRRRSVIRRLVAGAITVAGAFGLILFAHAHLFDSGDAVRPTGSHGVSIGYVPYWDQERAFDIVRENSNLFDEISPVWYSLDWSGQVVLADAEYTTVEPDTVDELQEQGIKVIPTVTNLRNGEWSPGLVQAMLSSPARIRAHVREIVDLVLEQGYDGIDIDYESLRAVDRGPFTTFLEQLATALHAENKTLAAAVHPKTSDEGDDERNRAQDYRAIGAAVDQVRLMAYDYSWDTSPPGPVAPAQWVEDVVAWTVTQIPPEKVILGIDLLGYDWGAGPGMTVDYGQAMRLAREQHATIRRDPDGTPWFAYDDSMGTRHEVWFEDAESADAKVRLVNDYGLGGAYFWRLGGADPSVWHPADSD